MNDLSTSLILLLLALVLLWAAVTDKLSNLLDAVDVVLGKKQVAAGGTAVAVTATNGTPLAASPTAAISFPSLPALGHMQQVPAV